MRPNTRLIFTESPGSQTFEVQDIPAIAARRRRARPVAADGQHLGDVRSTSGRSSTASTCRSRRRPSISSVTPTRCSVPSRRTRARPSPSRRPRSCSASAPARRRLFSGLRGLRTLSTRLAQHQRAGLEIARWLEGRPEVSRVLHPGLPSHPQHALWKRDFLGAERAVLGHAEAGSARPRSPRCSTG